MTRSSFSHPTPHDRHDAELSESEPEEMEPRSVISAQRSPPKDARLVRQRRVPAKLVDVAGHESGDEQVSSASPVRSMV